MLHFKPCINLGRNLGLIGSRSSIFLNNWSTQKSWVQNEKWILILLRCPVKKAEKESNVEQPIFCDSHNPSIEVPSASPPPFLPLSLSLSDFVCLSLSMYDCLYLCMYEFLYLSIYLSMSFSLYLCMSFSLYLWMYVSLFMCVSLYLCMSFSLSLYLYDFLILPMPLPLCLSLGTYVWSCISSVVIALFV